MGYTVKVLEKSFHTKRQLTEILKNKHALSATIIQVWVILEKRKYMSYWNRSQRVPKEELRPILFTYQKSSVKKNRNKVTGTFID